MDLLRTAKEKKSNLIHTVGFFMSFLLTEQTEMLRPIERVVVSTLVRLPAAMFCLPQVLDKLAPPSVPAAALSTWIRNVLQRLEEFAEGVKGEVSTLKGRADFVECLRVCVATLNLLQSDTADLQRGCLAAAAEQQIVKRAISATLGEESGFTDQVSEVLNGCLLQAP
jgi:hypothetical protein